MPSINTDLGERALSKMQHEMDWKSLKARCLRMYPTWSSWQVDRILHEYQRFLALKVATRDIYDTIVLAPILLDAMWRQHIVSTQQYYADCQMLLQSNQMLHYNADAPLNLNKNVRAKRMELTNASLCMMFSGMSKLSGDAKRIWEYDEGDASAGPIERMDSVLSSMSQLCDETKEDEETDFETTQDIQILTDSQDGDTTGVDGDVINAPSNISLRKNLRQPQCSKHPGEEPEAIAGTIQHERLLYIYRSGKVSKLRVLYPNETIQQIKSKIQRKSGLAPQEQCLQWEGIELDNRRSLGHYGIPNHAALVLGNVRQLPIHTPITPRKNQDRHILRREEDETENGDVTEEREEPLRRSSRPPKPPRQHPYDHYKPQYNSSLVTEDGSYVMSSSRKIIAKQNPRRRRETFLNKLQLRDNDHRDDQHFLQRNFRGYHHTHDRDDSYAEGPPHPKTDQVLQVFINTIMGFTISLSAQASDTAYQLKEMIKAQEDIPCTKQILILEGVPLNDDQQLADYTTSGKPILHILLRLQAGSSSVSGNSVDGASSSTMVGNSTMATVPRKRNKLLQRATASPASPAAVSNSEDIMSSAWR